MARKKISKHRKNKKQIIGNVKKIFNIDKLYFIFLLPLVLTLIIIVGNNSLESRGLYVFLLMALFWMLELLPLSVTSFLPVILFPIFGISDTNKLCNNYMTSTIMMYLGGLLFAKAIQHCHLHKRVALKVLSVMSKGIAWVMLGFMLTSMFLSMWIANTMATAMMIPIVEAVIEELYEANKSIQKSEEFDSEAGDSVIEEISENGKKENENEKSKNEDEKGKIEDEKEKNEDEKEKNEDEKEKNEDEKEKNEDKKESNEDKKGKEDSIEKIKEREDKESNKKRLKKENLKKSTEKMKQFEEQFSNMRKAMMLSICFSSNCGGTGTIIGTSTNLVFAQNVEYEFPHSTEITFASWMFYSIPSMLLCITFIWLYLLFGIMKYKKISSEDTDIIKNIIYKKYKELGQMTFHQYAVLLLFICVIILWFFRDPKFIPGWIELIRGERDVFKVTDATPVIFLLFFLFLIPSKPKSKKSQSLLSWKKAQRELNWDILLLFGGGFALAEGFKDSGINKTLGKQLEVLIDAHPAPIMMIICFIAVILTQAINNTATNTMLLPIVNQLALTLKVNPLFFSIPLTISCSFAFVLPVSTPPNALVYQASGMKTIEMIKPGIVVTFICLLTQYVMINSWGRIVFDFSTFPDWAIV